MNPTKTILLSILLSLTAQAGWHSLKTLGHYDPKAFALKKGVDYVEIRKYTENGEHFSPDANKKPNATKKKEVVLRMYRHPLSYFGTATKRSFQKTSPIKRYCFKKSGTGTTSNWERWYYCGFMIDSKGKQWRLENIDDVVDMIKPVDSLAKLRLVLWLHSNAEDYSEKKSYYAKYRKRSSGYTVREHHVAHGYDELEYSCGDYTFDYKISRSGKVLLKKLISKKKTWCGGN